jgi:hypothetical protein
MLVSKEGQIGPVQNLSTRNALSEIIRAFERKVFLLFSLFKGTDALRHRCKPLLQDVMLGVGVSNCLSFVLNNCRHK